MRTIFFIVSFALTNYLLGQNAELKNKLHGQFFNVPVLQSFDSIIEFAKNNQRHFDLSLDRDPATGKITYMDIDHWYYEKDTMYAYIYFRTGIRLDDQDSLGSAIIGINIPTKTLSKAKSQGKKLINEYSKFFSKKTTEKGKNPIMGGHWEITSLYLNEKDQFPFMIITWRSKADMQSNGYSIEVVKLGGGNKL